MQSLRTLDNNESLALVEYLPPNPVYLFTHSPDTFSQKLCPRVDEPNETNLGKFVERIASVVIWEIYGRRNIFKQPPLRNGKCADLVAISRFGACLFDFTTSPVNVLEKIEDYGKEWPVIVLIVGKDAIGGPQRYEWSWGFIWGLRNFANVIRKMPIKKAHFWADSLDHLDDIVKGAKIEVSGFQANKQYEENLVTTR